MKWIKILKMSIFKDKIKEKKEKNKVEDLVFKINYNIDKICSSIPSCISNLTNLTENGFRDIVLIGLKLILKQEYNPTSETLNSNGQCDIYIKLNNEELKYISEFKIWVGKKQIQKTFNQLFEYLDWQSESSIIFINKKNQNYENINKKIYKWLETESKKGKCTIFEKKSNQWFIEYKDKKRGKKYKIYLACYDFYNIKNNERKKKKIK
ncbi:hypothetical protein [Candidatus Phytoplasma sp. AldY-WA1]|uniref:hypothetical protein n=1 Tax=Candidatus Phytoplasma sp. AldY-WA1 TaxID=2852100 RepID=UPI00254FB8F5|nr:hypothetical protein [Candidatus Phytoplasma sp. AldY-WA1]